MRLQRAGKAVETTTAEKRVEAVLSRVFPGRRLDRILLVMPPDGDAALFRPETARRGRYYNYPPYGLLLLARQLRAAGVVARVVNLNHEILRRCRAAPPEAPFDFDAEWQAVLADEIAAFAPDLVGVTCMFTMTHVVFTQICRWLGTQDVPLAIGGVHVTNDLDRVLDETPDVDFAFTHEADAALVDFVRAVRGEVDAGALGQLVVVDKVAPAGRDRRIALVARRQPDAAAISVLPDYDLIDLSSYSAAGPIGSAYYLKPPGTRFTTVLSNRGCRARCTFCSVRNFNGVGVRGRAVSAVADEIELLRDRFGIGHITWLDDDLLYDHGRAIALFEEMARRELGVTWDAGNGLLAASITDEVVQAVAASGCIALTIGMESGNPEILRRIRKPANVDTLLRAAEVLRRFDEIQCSVFLIIGFPGETMAQLRDTMEVAARMDLDWQIINQLQPLPNTPIHDAMVEQGLIRPAASGSVRLSLGSYGKQNEIEVERDLQSANFADAFAHIPADAVPAPGQLADVWFVMNYHLNFARIFRETRPVKLRALQRRLANLSDLVAPEHGFSLYFLGYLQHRLDGRIEPEVVARLRRRLDGSDQWRRWFDAFGLSLAHLEEHAFPNASTGRRAVSRRN